VSVGGGGGGGNVSLVFKILVFRVGVPEWELGGVLVEFSSKNKNLVISFKECYVFTLRLFQFLCIQNCCF
jgi:hypothetical protein